MQMPQFSRSVWWNFRQLCSFLVCAMKNPAVQSSNILQQLRTKDVCFFGSQAATQFLLLHFDRIVYFVFSCSCCVRRCCCCSSICSVFSSSSSSSSSSSESSWASIFMCELLVSGRITWISNFFHQPSQMLSCCNCHHIQPLLGVGILYHPSGLLQSVAFCGDKGLKGKKHMTWFFCVQDFHSLDEMFGLGLYTLRKKKKKNKTNTSPLRIKGLKRRFLLGRRPFFRG